MILLITNKSDLTTDFVVKKIKEAKAPYYRFNTEELCVNVDLNLNFKNNSFILFDSVLNTEIDLLKVKSVYFRRPEIEPAKFNLSKAEYNFLTAEYTATLNGLYQILKKAYWLNFADNIRIAENKIYQLVTAGNIGFELPNSLITNMPEKAYSFYLGNDENCIIKPIKNGLVADNSKRGIIFTSKVELNQDNIPRVKASPVYLQNNVKKKGDIRVTIVGKKVFSAFIHSQDRDVSEIDWRKANSVLEHSVIKLPKLIRDKCLLLMKKLSLNFGAIDFILDNNGNYIFLEINPNGQWAWIETRLNYKISDEIASLLVKNSYT